MSFKDCIYSARDQGAITPEEAESLIGRYNEHVRANGAGHQAAKEALAAELKASAERKEHLAQLSQETVERIRNQLESYRGPDGKPDVFEASMRLFEHNGFTGYSAVKGRQLAILSLAHGEMAEVLDAFERGFYSGKRQNKPLGWDVMTEMLGEGTGKPEAKAFADAVRKSFDYLRERFNAAGGQMAKIENFFPQYHEPIALLKTGFERWRDFIEPKLDLEKMVDPLTGGNYTHPRLMETLRVIYDNVTTDGWAGRDPTMQKQGPGALANQRQEHRFIQFKSAADARAYDAAYGSGDPIKSIFEHLNGMAKDVALLEVLGPNPAATVEWLKQVTMSEHAKLMGGKDSLFNPQPSVLQRARGVTERSPENLADLGNVRAQRIEDLYQYLRGRRVISTQVRQNVSDARNVLTSIQLGGAALVAATTDPAIEGAARFNLDMPTRRLLGDNAKVFLDTASQYFADLPVARSFSDIIGHLTGMPQDMARRSGMIAEEFLHITGDEARFASTYGGRQWSRWLAERTLVVSGLEPLTNARRAVFGLELQAHLADMSTKAFADLPGRLAEKLKGYGIDEAAWDKLRALPQYTPNQGARGFLRPIDVAKFDRPLAEKMLEMILGETERAVPTQSLRAKSAVTGAGPRGTLATEIVDSFLQYKSFGLSVALNQAEALTHEMNRSGSRAGTLKWAATFLLPTTLGGALALQLQQLAGGKDPARMDDSKFWLGAMMKGGGFGIFDFVFNDWSRYGASFSDQITGPLVGVWNDVVVKGLIGNIQKLAHGDPSGFGKDISNLTARYMPILSSLWYMRTAYKRIVTDQLQWLLDPKAHDTWRRQEQQALKERGQGYWWPQGELAPQRAPDLSTALPR